MNYPKIEEIEKIYGVKIDDVPRTIAAFDKKTEFVVYRVEVKVLLKDMQKIFSGTENDPMVDFYDINQKEAIEIEKIIKQKLRLDEYDYQIGLYAPDKK